MDNFSESWDSEALPRGYLLKSRYQIEAMLGRGGFGITYKATDIEKHRKVALKELFPQSEVYRNIENLMILPKDNMAEDFEATRQRFRNEANTIYELRECPEIVRVYELFPYLGTEYYTMELLEGESLISFLRHNGPMTWNNMAPIVRSLLLPLKAMHRKGFIHRDIKPDNIYLTGRGKIKLIDFGNVRNVTNDHFTILLTEYFAPVEQYDMFAEQGPYTDIYSLAATIYYCITGDLPELAHKRLFSIRKNGTDPLVPVQNKMPNLDPKIAAAIMKGLEPEAANRYQNADEFAQALGLNTSVSMPVRNYVICGVSGFMAGKNFPLETGKNIYVGREEYCSILFPEQAKSRGVSRMQCILLQDENGRAWVWDEKSTYGVSINNRQIPKKEWCRLRRGDRLTFASEVFTVN